MTVDMEYAFDHSQASAKANIWERSPQEDGTASPRFFARWFDQMIFRLLLVGLVFLLDRVFVFGLADILYNYEYLPFMLLSTALDLVFYFILEVFFLWKWGRTPGKLLCNLSVIGECGSGLSLKLAICRTWRVYFYGLGLELPLVNLFTMLKSKNDLESNGSTNYDILSKTKVQYSPISQWRLFAVVLIIVLVSLTAYQLEFQMSL